MKEWIYQFHGNGYYLANLSDKAYFDGVDQAVLIVKPCDYELKLSGQVLNRAQCSGYRVEVTDRGAAKFYDWQGSLLAEMPGTEKQYKGFRLQWKQDSLCVCFGQMETVDNYPNCDGESDRWEERWSTEHKVELATV